MKTESLLTLLAASSLLLASCSPEAPAGNGDDTPAVPDYIPGTLLAEDNRTTVTLREGTDEVRTLGLYYVTDKELAEARTVTLAVEESATTLPKANYEVPASLEVAAGSDRSGMQSVTFRADGLESGDYTLVLKETAEDGTKASDPIEFRVTVRTPQTSAYGFHPDYNFVCYVNTNDYQPLIADALFLTESNIETSDEINYLYSNIVNLRTVVLKNNGGRAELVLGKDMEHVLANRTKYILPLQDQGRKVCLTLEGGATGLGFCNLTDAQTDDFVAQVRKVIYDNDLDGVNFFDKGAAYEQAESNGLPAMNTTSYPKLIQKMRAALPGKLVTLADYGEPTAYFYDTEATGGIKVGEYIDYAWSGYMERNELLQILDPWEIVDYNSPEVAEQNELALMSFGTSASFPFTKYTRKPIAGLSQDRYGCISIAAYYSSLMDESFDSYFSATVNPFVWKQSGFMKSNIIVYGDLISNHQGSEEGRYADLVGSFVSRIMPDIFETGGSKMYLVNFNAESYPETQGAYDWLVKDWE